jgi:hypothetical protein
MSERAAQPKPNQAKKGISVVAALAVAAFLGLGVYGKLLTTKPVDQIEPIPGEYQAVVEAIVGIALIVLHRWGVMWAFTALLFSGFTGVTLHRLLIGAESCGCFGGISIPPAITLSLDASIVFMSAWLARAWGLRPWGFAATLSIVPTLVVAGAVYSKHATPPSEVDLSEVFGETPSQSTPTPAPTPDSPADPDDAAGAPETTPAPTQDLGAAVETGRITARDALLRLPGAFDRGALGNVAKPAWLDDLRRASDPNAPLPWLIYVYNRNCDICQAHLPEWNDARQIYEEDLANDKAAMGVLLIEWEDLIPLKIPTYAWGAQTPITLLVDDGKVIRDWRGESQPMIVDMYFTTQDQGLDAALEQAIPGTN